jgi:hypothetical protein
MQTAAFVASTSPTDYTLRTNYPQNSSYTCQCRQRVDHRLRERKPNILKQHFVIVLLLIIVCAIVMATVIANK